ncbi:mitochondrial 54S ribosomal protein bL17m [Limtongia smithiae]|uniref:mitochondrial 54S ribosomal protein bL17m n=1 Tax=Limtongia smithiae TaxID=1125753 RepID=UPI0034CE27ED
MPSQGSAHRTLSRPSGHRRALLRNLVTSLIEHDSITTTYARAKEAQPLVEKLITAAKENTNATQHITYGFVFQPKVSMPKLYDVLAKRYETRTGGYSRVLHLEPRQWDSAPMAVLELVDGKKDLRLYLTAKAVARAETAGQKLDKATALNVKKIIAGSPEGNQVLREKVELMKTAFFSGRDSMSVLTELSKSQKAE